MCVKTPNYDCTIAGSYIDRSGQDETTPAIFWKVDLFANVPLRLWPWLLPNATEKRPTLVPFFPFVRKSERLSGIGGFREHT